MSEPIQRIIVESALPTPTGEPNEDLYSLWAYAGVSLKELRNTLHITSPDCPRVANIREWMEALDLNTVGVAALFGVTRPTVSARYLSDSEDNRVPMGTQKMIRAALLTGYFRHHPHAPLYTSAMNILDGMIGSGEIDNVFRPLVVAKRDQPDDLDRIRLGVVAMLRPDDATQATEYSYVKWCRSRGINIPVGESREPYHLTEKELAKMSGDFNRQFFYRANFTECVLSGEFTEAVFVDCVFNDAVLSGDFTGAEFINSTSTNVSLNGTFDFAQFSVVAWDVIECQGTFRHSRLRRTAFINQNGLDIDVIVFDGAEGLASYVDVCLPNVKTIEGRTVLKGWLDVFPEAKFWSQTCEEGMPMGDALHDRYF